MTRQSDEKSVTTGNDKKSMTNRIDKKPDWLKVSYNEQDVKDVAALVDELHLNTVCTEASCPNLGECFRKRTATYMVMGSHCTRNCRFCDVICQKPEPLDPEEPKRVAEAAAHMKLQHVVVTQVTRDDLPDGGAMHMAQTIREIRKALPTATIEVLVSDMQGDTNALDVVLEAAPDVFGHNIEMPKSLHPTVRPQAIYERSLAVLQHAKEYVKKRGTKSLTKTGFMVGLGETEEEIAELFCDLEKTKVDIVTVGQYLQPSPAHHPLARYATPEDFAHYAKMGQEAGIPVVVSHPLVRSSYRAHEAMEEARALQGE